LILRNTKTGVYLTLFLLVAGQPTSKILLSQTQLLQPCKNSRTSTPKSDLDDDDVATDELTLWRVLATIAEAAENEIPILLDNVIKNKKKLGPATLVTKMFLRIFQKRRSTSSSSDPRQVYRLVA
jgi:hypothetical protein